MTPPGVPDDQEDFYTWVLLGNPAESTLESKLPFDEGRPLPSPAQVEFQFELSLGGAMKPTLRASKAAKDWLFKEAFEISCAILESEPDGRDPRWAEPDELMLISFAPRKEIEQLWGCTCAWNLRNYKFLPVRFSSPCPYQHRFLALRHTKTDIVRETDGLDVHIPKGDEGGGVTPNFWPHVRRLPLTSDDAKDLFQVDESLDTEINALKGFRAIEGSLFLPPVRVFPEGNDELEVRLRENQSYFSPDRQALRSFLIGNSGALQLESRGKPLPEGYPHSMNEEAPLSVQALHLMDNPLVRDILLDGGRFAIDAPEGQPTRLSLQFVGGDGSPAAYRRRFFQDDPASWRIGPTHFDALRAELQKDLKQLVPNGLETTMIDPGKACSWQCDVVGKFVPRGDSGSGISARIDAIHESFINAPVQKTLYHLVVEESSHIGTRDSADNHHAENLFVTHAWRYPSGEQVRELAVEPPENLGWREALTEQLLNSELMPNSRLMAPKAREVRWNADTSKARFRLTRNDKDNRWELDVLTSESDAKLWKRRFLLPLGSVLLSKTLILDHLTRSQLDAGFVLG